MQHGVAMREHVDTPAFRARILHQMVKTFVAEMEKEGFSQDDSYMVLVNVVMRLAFEHNGDAGVQHVLLMMDKLAEGMERPRLRLASGGR